MTGSSDSIEQRLRTLQIMHAALMMGVVMFAGIVFVLQRPATMSGTPLTIIRMACAGVILMSIVVPMVLRNASIRMLRSRGESQGEDVIFGFYFGQSLIKAALAEGAGLLAAVTFLLSADKLDLIAVGAAVGLLLVTMPTHWRWRAFLEDARDMRGSM